MSILFTFGTNDKGVASVLPDANGQPNIHVDGNCNVLGKINLGPVRPVPYMIYGPNAEQPPLGLPQRPSLIFNQISKMLQKRSGENLGV